MFFTRRNAIALPITGGLAFSQSKQSTQNASQGSTLQVQAAFLKELDREAVSARILISSLPADRFDWRPHPKSRPLAELAWYLAAIPDVVPVVAFSGVQEVTKIAWPPRPGTVGGMVEGFDRGMRNVKINLSIHNGADFARHFSMREGDTELFGYERR